MDNDSGRAPIKAPFPYFGGKSRVAAAVWERFGDAGNYVEPFAGSLAVLLGRSHPARIETINDLDASIANFWRAVQADPDAVAQWADWPVNEVDLYARHLWLVNQGRALVNPAALEADPDYYDAKVAGWWVWGISQWIGSGWCAARGANPAAADAAGEQGGDGNTGRGVHRQLPHLNAGMGVHRQLPHLGDAGMGVHRKLPHLGDAGRGEFLAGYMRALQERLRGVRVCCGNWDRVLGPSPTTNLGMTAVFLDPPYSHAERQGGLYAVETDVAAAVRVWAIANGDNPLLRIALCGYFEEHDADIPATWERMAWKAQGGYGNRGTGRGRENAAREMIWFNKSCIRPDRPTQTAMF